MMTLTRGTFECPNLTRQKGSETNIGLNLVYLVPGETGGTETYARELIAALVRERPDIRLTTFVNREAAETGGGPWGELVPAVTVPVRARRRVEWVYGEQQLLPRFAARAGVDVLHSLASTAPVRGSFRRIVTIHDLIYRIYPEAHFGLRAKGMSLLVPLAARRSDRIIAPSKCTRDDLIRLLAVPPAKIDVVAEGVSAEVASSTPESDLRAQYDLADRVVVLTASAMRPHKNLRRLLDAWALLPVERRPLLVLPGYSTEHEAELSAYAVEIGVSSDTRFVGWVPPADLEGLYRLAECFVFPSLYEGFGLPVLEAMARGVPVACSDRGALGEVAGEAALIFDPESPRSIADAVEKLRRDTALAQRLRTAGLERARSFTWEETARATLRSYNAVLSSDT
jgi:glycosyltransferase involved in cell wall biosynthesis